MSPGFLCLARLVTDSSGLFIYLLQMVQSATNGNFAKHSNEIPTLNSRNELIPIIQNEDQQFVDARHLHKFLNVKTKFNQWIVGRIKEYDFIEGLEYFRNFGKSITKPTNEYQLTFDMAKELAMVERNEQGRTIRRWFISKEKELREAKGKYTLPPMKKALKGVKTVKINGQKLYNYKEVLVRAGYSPNVNSARKRNYAMHFILFDNRSYITEDYANHLVHSRAVYANRKVLQAAQHVLPLDFGDNSVLTRNYKLL